METASTVGKVREMAGGAQEAIGEMLDDANMKLSGKAKELCGKSQQLMSDAAVVARDALAEKPLVVLGAAVGIGIALGALWAWNRD